MKPRNLQDPSLQRGEADHRLPVAADAGPPLAHGAVDPQLPVVGALLESQQVEPPEILDLYQLVLRQKLLLVSVV